LKWEDLQVLVLEYLDGAYTVLFRMFPLLLGALVAQSSLRAPFTSDIVGSNPVGDDS
jgi:hypothetical protein